jgi:hypothetical protein
MAKRIKVKGTPPSSTRKKLVKEGSPKFIGPRTPKSDLSETMGRKKYQQLKQFGLDDGIVSLANRVPKKERVPSQMLKLRKKSEDYDLENSEPEYGRGGIGSKKLKRLLELLEYKLKGGGQEFDDMD